MCCWGSKVVYVKERKGWEELKWGEKGCGKELKGREEVRKCKEERNEKGIEEKHRKTDKYRGANRSGKRKEGMECFIGKKE